MTRFLLSVCLILALVHPALGVDPLTNHLSLDGKGLLPGDGASGPRTGGDTIQDATPIASLPFSDTASTCGFANDYDEDCPYTGNIGPDVVYSYVPLQDQRVDVDLCGSLYDTKLYIFENQVGNPVACNDDAGCGYSGYQSRVTNVLLHAGNTYYVVVDAYSTQCGTYVMLMTETTPCEVPCPPGAIPEGEPPCQDGYVDYYNGGCQTMGFQPIQAQAEGCATLCGKSCTYHLQGLSYRDTDWFDCVGTGQPAIVRCTAEFPLQLILIYVADCSLLQYDIAQVPVCTEASLSRVISAGAHFWVWVGNQYFSGWPESDYVLQVCGIQGGATPAERTSWGGIKARYRD